MGEGGGRRGRGQEGEQEGGGREEYMYCTLGLKVSISLHKIVYSGRISLQDNLWSSIPY